MNITKQNSVPRVLGLAVVILCLLAWAAPAYAALGDGFSITGFDGSVSNQDGTPFTQAGGHPYSATTTIRFSTTTNTDGTTIPDGDNKDLHVELPAGFIGNPNAVPKCTEDQLAVLGLLAAISASSCPVASQVGVVTIDLAYNFGTVTLPVFNMEPPSGEPGLFGFNVLGQGIVHLVPSVRSGGDYGLTVDINDITQTDPILSTSLTLWGVPADPGHDAQRGQLCMSAFGTCFHPNPAAGDPPVSAGVPPTPFLTNPTNCSAGPLTTRLRADSWQHAGDFLAASFVSHDNGTPPNPQGVTGCDRLPFSPSLTLRPETTTAGSPSAYAVHLSVPQNDNPFGIATAALKKAVVTLPSGVSVSPSAADGLGACSVDQIGVDSASEPSCPDSSKIGTVRIDSPLLSDPLTGSIYLAQPTSTQLLKIYLVAEAHGVLVKLPGTIDANSSTGQLTATFDNNPQLPFTELLLNFKGGPRAPLVNSPTCGTATTSSSFTAYSGQTASSTDSYEVTGPCSHGFAPTFSAGMVTPAGGNDSPFTLTFSRSDQDQMLGNISVDLPKGLLGRIASAPLCPDTAANAGTCSAVSRIGSTTTAAGPGSNPFNLPGSVYITGPYKGAPFGMSIVVPAIAGPFNLGTVVVRAAIFVDKNTTALRVVSDPLPTILQGIPLQIRSVNITIDRPGFMFNPTDCSPSSINARITSGAGAASNVSSRFQVANCASLPFKPSMSVSVGGKGHTATRASTPLKVVLTMPKGNANNKAVDVTLPSTLNAHLAALQHPCTEVDFQADRCGPKAKVGTASAVTPVLRDPLRGGVFFVKNPRKGALPLMRVALRGQVAVDLTSTIRTTPLIRAQFLTVPDVPITRFTLSLVSGTQGPVGVRTSLCSGSSAAKAAFRGHNGKLVNASPKLKVTGCAKAKPKAKAKTQKTSTKKK
ncbi:MAG: hypothetical protein JWQ48_2127 [Conexibacter sp.]|nr:hypothetical protein [Conexibacter sp.]